MSANKVDDAIYTEMERDFYRAQLQNIVDAAQAQPDMTAQAALLQANVDLSSPALFVQERQVAPRSAPGHLERA